MKAHIAVFIVIQLLLTGCATNQISVTYLSDPPGATIVRPDGTTVGRAPVTLNYSVNAADRSRGEMSVSGLYAQWISGARFGYSHFTAYLKNGTNQSITLQRPQNAPGLAADMQYALELEKLGQMKRQTEAQESAAWEASRAASAAEASARAANVNGAHLPPKFGVDVLTIVRNIGFGFACWAYL